MHRSFESRHVPAHTQRPVIYCFSHLRWDLVFQRPQHIMTRLSNVFDVVYWEEPRYEAAGTHPLLERQLVDRGLLRATPILPDGLDAAATDVALRDLLLDEMAARPAPALFWYYTPMMASFSRSMKHNLTIYDCMDELANFDFAPADLASREEDLMASADLVLCGGRSLYEVRQDRHANIHCYPSGVDVAHFIRDPATTEQPSEQAELTGPRLGFFGVIDERMDLVLLAEMARLRPDWSFVMIGPIVKISPDSLPKAANIHWLGRKEYARLPDYAVHWDVALMPFARNASTEFISPTKTPEYMACGLPVVSTPIKDVVDTYGALGSIRIAKDAVEFVAASEELLAADRNTRAHWAQEASQCLTEKSWDDMVARITRQLQDELIARQVKAITPALPVKRRQHYDVLVVGAGFAGSVMAERLAAASGKSVLVIDKRDHIAGNAFDHHDAAGILVHKYGPHIFHTNSREIVDYLSRFTEWRDYEHRVLAEVEGMLVPVPINRTTLNQLYGLSLATDEDAAAYLQSVAVDVGEIRNSRDTVVSQVGDDLYNKFFEGYTRKQWGVDPSELDKSVAARVPARTNTDDRYFVDTFQCMPKQGYTAMFSAMLNHPNIDVMTGQCFTDLPDEITWDHLVWSGPIDEYFDHRLGTLPYRSLRFEHETLEVEQAQPVAVVNYPHIDVPYTRITEYKHLTGQIAPMTSITREYPAAEGDPYYPLPTTAAQALYRRYDTLARELTGVTFVGRLATYRYYNMDQIVGQALATWRKLDARWQTQAVSVPVGSRTNERRRRA